MITLYHIVCANFLERMRRYSSLLISSLFLLFDIALVA